MPGHVMPMSAIQARVLDAMEVGVARSQIEVRDSASFLAPKLTDELAATIEARRPTRTARSVSGKVITTQGYGRWQETKLFYHHRTGQARFMAGAILQNAQNISQNVREAVAGIF